MNTKIIAIIAVVAIAVIATAAIIAFVILPGLFTSPVDISGTNPSTTLTPQELLPTTILGNPTVPDTFLNQTLTVYGDTTTFEVEYARIEYDGIVIRIFKAQSTSEASDTLRLILEDEDWFGGASSYVQTNDWFTAIKEGRSVFFWRSNTWIFGVDAENDDTRNNATNDLVQHLRTL